MSFDRPCEVCRKSEAHGKPLEVCYSDRHEKFTCLACHFDVQEQAVASVPDNMPVPGMTQAATVKGILQ